MLPTPSVATFRRKTFPLAASPRKKLLDNLTRRSRLTNLAVFLIASVCSISLLINLRQWALLPTLGPLPTHTVAFSTANYPSTRKKLDHLVVVPCHSIWQGTSSWLEEKDWLLEPYQKGPGRVRAFYQHIERSVEIAEQDANSLLIFSGGQTKPFSATTEAESYLRLAQTSGLIPHETPKSFVHSRSTTENYAMDSYQNLLFSVARFREFTGHYPSKITVVGYEFKRARFTELHRKAVRWPLHKFTYVGVDPEYEGSTNALEGERANGYIPYTHDTYGCHSLLLGKRQQRNPFSRFHPYYTSSPELGSLFDWCPNDFDGGETTLFSGDLPWDHPTIARES
ncbi:hypothetical protein BDN70DRAFT_882547 [Pholiota conissans]|uniref:DUF218 domain-containing protein n=1 Tax=Pholiota conissans TaxID=109636 RepID=A0A9P5YWE3_9AGAR|nr:hypothetical protein BDN70DRAFT_882547 [Pholiota conissans]